ncbi:hypothetical protein [Spirosoma fluminis]
MNKVRLYSPGGEGDQGGSSANDQESAMRQEGTHDPGNTPLDDQEELPGGYVHGHVDQGEDE